MFSAVGIRPFICFLVCINAYYPYIPFLRSNKLVKHMNSDQLVGNCLGMDVDTSSDIIHASNRPDCIKSCRFNLGILWFRNNLRIHDNKLLNIVRNSHSNHTHVLCVYAFDHR